MRLLLNPSRSRRVAAALSLVSLTAFGLTATGCQPEAPTQTPAPEMTASPSASPAPEASPAADPNAVGPPAPAGPKDLSKLGPKAVKTSTGLQYEDLKVGTGAEAKPTSEVTVHYTGYLTNGTKFDSSLDRGEPFTVPGPISQGQVIPGWQQGFQGMKIGGKRRLVIPSDLGYGANGTPDGTIPPNSMLVFDVELLKVK